MTNKTEKEIYNAILHLVDQGIEMEPMRVFADKLPSASERESYYLQLGANANHMRKLQAEAKELELAAQGLNNEALTAATREVGLVVSLNQKAHRDSLTNTYGLLARVAESVWSFTIPIKKMEPNFLNDDLEDLDLFDQDDFDVSDDDGLYDDDFENNNTPSTSFDASGVQENNSTGDEA